MRARFLGILFLIRLGPQIRAILQEPHHPAMLLCVDLDSSFEQSLHHLPRDGLHLPNLVTLVFGTGLLPAARDELVDEAKPRVLGGYAGAESVVNDGLEREARVVHRLEVPLSIQRAAGNAGPGQLHSDVLKQLHTIGLDLLPGGLFGRIELLCIHGPGEGFLHCLGAHSEFLKGFSFRRRMCKQADIARVAVAGTPPSAAPPGILPVVLLLRRPAIVINIVIARRLALAHDKRMLQPHLPHLSQPPLALSPMKSWAPNRPDSFVRKYSAWLFSAFSTQLRRMQSRRNVRVHSVHPQHVTLVLYTFTHLS